MLVFLFPGHFAKHISKYNEDMAFSGGCKLYWIYRNMSSLDRIELKIYSIIIAENCDDMKRVFDY